MTWLNHGEEIRKLRAEVDYLRSRLDKVEMDTRFYEPLNPLRSIGYAYGLSMRTIAISKVVSEIVRHLGLQVRIEPARSDSVVASKPEQDGQSTRP